MVISENFREALKDYIFLIEKKYPEKTVHEMVSTRHALNHFERSILYRGVTIKETADKRKNRIITIEQWKPGTLKPWNFGTLERWNNPTLHIDIFNVLFTVAAYLRGFPVYISMDGLLRDASEGHESNEWVQHLEKALEICLGALIGLPMTNAVFYLDNPLHISGMIAQEIEKGSEGINCEILIIRDESPDHLIRSATEGILATSDSVIIDKSSLPVFDLPRFVLESCFEPKLFRLNDVAM